jgi:hypothetical protein
MTKLTQPATASAASTYRRRRRRPRVERLSRQPGPWMPAGRPDWALVSDEPFRHLGAIGAAEPEAQQMAPALGFGPVLEPRPAVEGPVVAQELDVAGAQLRARCQLVELVEGSGLGRRNTRYIGEALRLVDGAPHVMRFLRNEARAVPKSQAARAGSASTEGTFCTRSCRNCCAAEVSTLF